MSSSMNERPAGFHETKCSVDGHPCEGQGTDAECRTCHAESRRNADLRGAQLLMVSSELAGDPKMDHDDRSDPRWTPTLHEAWRARQKHKEDAAQIVELMCERDGLKEHIGALIADIEVMRKRESSLTEQLRIKKMPPQSNKNKLGCVSCRNATWSIAADSPCDNCEQDGSGKGSLWQPLDASVGSAGLWEQVSRERFLSVYGPAIAVQWAKHISEGRGLDDGAILRFVEGARALAQWTEDVQR